jgi:hypothetical protein
MFIVIVMISMLNVPCTHTITHASAWSKEQLLHNGR